MSNTAAEVGVVYDYVGGFTRDWLYASVIDKAWYLAVFAACATAFVRAVQVGRWLFVPRASRFTLAELLADPRLSALEIARLALGGCVLPSREGLGARLAAFSPDGEPRLAAAQARFRYLWHLADARVAATRGLLCAAVLITLLASIGAVPGLLDEAFGHGAYLWSTIHVVSRAGVRLTVMLSQCLLICVVWTTLDTALRRRQATWDYAVATVRDGAAGGTI